MRFVAPVVRPTPPDLGGSAEQTLSRTSGIALAAAWAHVTCRGLCNCEHMQLSCSDALQGSMSRSAKPRRRGGLVAASQGDFNQATRRQTAQFLSRRETGRTPSEFRQSTMCRRPAQAAAADQVRLFPSETANVRSWQKLPICRLKADSQQRIRLSPSKASTSCAKSCHLRIAVPHSRRSGTGSAIRTAWPRIAASA